MLNRKLKPLAVAIGAAFAVSAATGLAVADDEGLFEARVLDGVVVADSEEGADDGEGNCGEGKCGEGEGKGDGDGEGNCGEGNCGDDKEGEHGEESEEEAE